MDAFTDLAVPVVRAYTIRRACVPKIFLSDGFHGMLDSEGCALVDLFVAEGLIARVTVAEPAVVGEAVDVGGRQVWPTLVDMHAHLDKGHTVARTPNQDGSFAGACDATMADRIEFWDAADLRTRMSFGMLCAEAHGVGAIRTHLDSTDDGPHRDQATTTWGIFREIRDEWAGRVTLQGVGLVPVDVYATAHGRRLADIVEMSGGLLGGVTRPRFSVDGEGSAELDAHLDRLFVLAIERDLDIDLHVDESGDPTTASLDAVARATIRHSYEGRVNCGHCCSLALQPADLAAATIARVAEAGITIVTLPTVNMYLQDRQAGRTPRWRGVAPVQELIAAGVPVAVAGDNCRDAFHAYGDHDMLDTLRQAIRILQLDHPLIGAPALAGPVPAAVMKVRDAGTIRVGAPANLILLDCTTLNQIVARSQTNRIVIKDGARLVAAVPSFKDLAIETSSIKCRKKIT